MMISHRKISLPLWQLATVLLLTFLLGGGVAWTVTDFFRSDEGDRMVEHLAGTGRLTNPLLGCETNQEEYGRALRPFKGKVQALLREKIEEGVITEGSVYFRSMNNGMVFGINENIGFHPASMLKVPIMMAYYKRAEINPQILDEKLLFDGKSDTTGLQGILPSRQLVSGQRYAVEELIYRMICFSDNNAAQVLVDNIDKQEIDMVLCDIDINVDTCDQERMITTQAYAGFFRVLYNATYLSRTYSEKALDLLIRSEFAEGMRAGLPPGQQAATKFGEWGSGPDPDIVQFHEFGIIYYPGRPYLLGIMTRGPRGSGFAGVIRDVSRLIYESIDEQLGRSVSIPAKTPTPLFR